MTTTSALQTKPSSLLRNAILGNAAFSLVSGLALALGSGPLAALMGLPDSTVLLVMGVILIPYAYFLYRGAIQQPIAGQFAVTVILLDIAWVTGSLILLASGLVPLTTVGKWGIAIIADLVALFALVQFLGLRRATKQSG